MVSIKGIVPELGHPPASLHGDPDDLFSGLDGVCLSLPLAQGRDGFLLEVVGGTPIHHLLQMSCPLDTSSQ